MLDTEDPIRHEKVKIMNEIKKEWLIDRAESMLAVIESEIAELQQRIEETIENNSIEVEKCAVIVKEDPKRMHIAIAFVLLKDKIVNSEQLINTIKENLKANLPEHMQPKEVYIIDNIPVTPPGTIDYRKLEDRIANQMN